jgi:hypothetical protein
MTSAARRTLARETRKFGADPQSGMEPITKSRRILPSAERKAATRRNTERTGLSLTVTFSLPGSKT